MQDVSPLRDGDGVTAKTDVGPVVCGRSSADESQRPSSGGYVCVRPENVKVRTTTEGQEPTLGDAEFLATVDSSEFLGDRLELVVRAADIPITVSARAGLGCRPGDQVVVGFDANTTTYLAS